MKKIGLSGLICLILVISSGCQKYNDPSERPAIPGNARLKRVLFCATIDSKEPISIIKEYEYNESGKVSKVTCPMYQDGAVSGIISYDLYEYDLSGRLSKIGNYNANLNLVSGFVNLKNYTYSYSANGWREKEYIEYPLINSFEYSLYKYNNGRVVKIEKYGISDELDSYTILEYDHYAKLVRETSFGKNDAPYSYTLNTYSKGLLIKSDMYSGKYMDHQREIKMTYDNNNNLIILESNELSPYSSAMSYVHKYQYFDK